MTSRKRISRAGSAGGGRVPDGSAPAGAIAGSRRSTAATGAAAPSSAQLSPPNAIIETPTALCAKTTSSPSVEAAGRRRRSRATRTPATLARDHEQQAPQHRPLAQPRRLRTAARAGACGARRSDRSSSRPGRTAAAPCWPADRRRADRRSRRRAARRAPRRCCDRARRALSRSSQCVASQAPASTSGAHHA